ncbi:MAG: L,D-transpeptidase [Myxococcota bacterium]
MNPVVTGKGWVRLAILIATMPACAVEVGADDPEAEFGEGAPFDEDGPYDTAGKADRPDSYEVPTDLPELEAPEVIVSLDGLTTQVFDRTTGFSRVYEVGVGRRRANGTTLTPTGHYETGPDNRDPWWYIDRRWSPEYYMGYPFLRLTVLNSRGHATYGFHGPVTQQLEVGYVSAGCIRMHREDIVELYWLLHAHPKTPITIQKEKERDAAGKLVRLGRDPVLFAADARIEYGDSVGPRNGRGFIGDPCETDAECGHFPGASRFAYCHAAGFCTQACEGFCPDLSGAAQTFCAERFGTGFCLSRAGDENHECASVPGTTPELAPRHVGSSTAPPAEAVVCMP